VFNMNVTPELTYGELFKRAEWEHSVYSFEEADIEMLGETFDKFEQEARRLLARGLVLPAYDFVLKTSHLFNVLDARGALGVARRTEYLGRIRALARQAASGFLKQREQAGYPLLAKGVGAR